MFLAVGDAHGLEVYGLPQTAYACDILTTHGTSCIRLGSIVVAGIVHFFKPLPLLDVVSVGYNLLYFSGLELLYDFRRHVFINFTGRRFCCLLIALILV